MKITSLTKNLLAAAVLAGSAIGASANTTDPVSVNGPSFNNVVLGTISVTGLSDILGSVIAAQSVSFGPFTFSLQPVTFTSASVGSLVDLDASAAGFSFKNVAEGTYQIKASGNVQGFGVLTSSYNVTPVPEPETLAMLLAGLGLMGTIVRRRQRNA